MKILGQVWYLIVSIPDLCNLTYFDVILQKHVGFSQLSQNHFKSIWGYFLENFKKFHRFIEE